MWWPASSPYVVSVGGTQLQDGWAWNPSSNDAFTSTGAFNRAYWAWTDGGRSEAVWNESDFAGERALAGNDHQFAAGRADAEGAAVAVLGSADHDIHAAIAQATHNLYFVSLDRQLRGQLSLGTDALPYSAAIRQRAVRQHIAIADAIESGQGALAAKLTRRHFLELVEHPLRELQQRVRTRDSITTV